MIVGFMLPIAACSGLEVVEKRYATYAEAKRKKQYWDWIPEWLPVSAHDIVDIHNNDSLWQTLTFKLSPSDVPAMIGSLRPVERPRSEAALKFAAGVGWAVPPQSTPEVYYVCSPDKGVLIVDRAGGRAFYRRSGEWATKRCGPRA